MRASLLFAFGLLLGATGFASGCGGSDEGGLKGKSGSGGTGAGGSGGTAAGGSGGTTAGGSGGVAGSGAVGGGGAAGGGGVAGSAATGGTGATDGGSDACVSVPEICGDSLDNDCDGTVDNGCAGLGTYVSANTGNDNNPGTQASPVQTIAKGMANAKTIGGGADVYIAEGHYTEKVTLVEGTSLLGGYQCSTTSCTWANDPTKYDAAIFAVDAAGVLADNTITQATSVDGLRLMGQDGAGAGNGRTAITLAGGTPKLTRNKIYGPNVNGGSFTTGRSIGLTIFAPSNDTKGTLVQGNDIKGGTSNEASIGILMDTATFPSPGPTYAQILGNTISAGSAKSSAGISAWTSGSGTLVENNDISAGAASTGTAFGINMGKNLAVNANRINTGTSVATCPASNTSYCGGIASYSATGSITNNVVLGADAPISAGLMLMEAEVPAGTVIVNGNVFDGAGSASSSGVSNRSAAVVSRIGTCNNCGFNGVNGRVRNNLLLGGKAVNRFGVYEDAPAGKTTHPQVLENNLFFFVGAGTNVLYRQYNGTTGVNHTTIAAVNGLTVIPTVGNNITGDPLLNATWHLGAGSPAINKGTATEAPPKDMDGEARPKGTAIDIGADEAG